MSVFHVALVTVSLFIISPAAPPARNCSTSVSLCPQNSTNYMHGDNCTLVNDDSDVTFDSISTYLEGYKSLIPAGECLEVKLSPGAYSLSLLPSPLNFSAVFTASEKGVSLTCLPIQEDTNATASPFWFHRPSNCSEDEFFVQLSGINFESCPRPIQFDNMDYVGISNCNFR